MKHSEKILKENNGYRYDDIRKMESETDTRLVTAFLNCSEYVKNICNFNIADTKICVYDCSYISYWVEDGILYLGKGDNGYAISVVLSTNGTDIITHTSQFERYEDIKAFDNQFLELFLLHWKEIKDTIVEKNKIYNAFEV